MEGPRSEQEERGERAPDGVDPREFPCERPDLRQPSRMAGSDRLGRALQREPDGAIDEGSVASGAPEATPATADSAAAQEMLGALAGKRHRVITGIAVTWEGNTLYQASHNEVTFAAQSAAQIRRYVDSNEAMDKAGAYGIQGSAAMFITHLSGSYSGVMGLPLYETAVLLRQSGIEI